MEEKTGALISKKRKEKQLTQDELAKDLHVTRQAVSNWERNVAIPDRPTIEKLSAILGENMDQLFRVSTAPKPKVKDDEKMEKIEIETNQSYEMNKYDTAIGLFYAVSLFIGALIGLILGLMLNADTWQGWIVPAIVGLLSFLILGLLSHGIITLVRKD